MPELESKGDVVFTEYEGEKTYFTILEDVRDFHEKNKFLPGQENAQTLEFRLLKMVEEIGEVARALHKYEGEEQKEEVLKEGVDLIFTTLGLFLGLDIARSDLDREWKENQEGVMAYTLKKIGGQLISSHHGEHHNG